MKRSDIYVFLSVVLIFTLVFCNLPNNIAIGQTGESSSSGSCVAQFTTCGCKTVCAPEDGFVVGECFNPTCNAMLDPTSVNCAVVNGECTDTLANQVQSTPACEPQFSNCLCMAICTKPGDIVGVCFNPDCTEDFESSGASSLKCELVNNECVVSPTATPSNLNQVTCQAKFSNCSCMTICAKSNQLVGVCFNPGCTGMLDQTAVNCVDVNGECKDLTTLENLPAGSTTPVLSANFNGVWKGIESTSSSTISSSSSGSSCIFCPQIVPECAPGEILEPQTCNSCAHCLPELLPFIPETGDMCIICAADIVEDCAATGLVNVPQSCTECQHCVEPTSSSSSGGLPILRVPPNTPKLKKNMIELKLCVKNGELTGFIIGNRTLLKGVVKSQTVISENEVFVVIQDKDSEVKTVNLKLTGNKEMVVTFDDKTAFNTRRLNQLKCPAPPKPSMSGSSSSGAAQ